MAVGGLSPIRVDRIDPLRHNVPRFPTPGPGARMPTWGRWVLGVLVAAVVLGGPAAYYRSGYTNQKRFRVVTPGKFYRSGQFTAGGLRDIIRGYHIRTVINLQEENRDPHMPEEWLSQPHVRETEVCRELGVNYY